MAGSVAVLGVGASEGLGAAVARRFVRGGLEAFVAGRNAERLAATAAAIGARAIPCDVTEPDAVAAFFDAVEAQAGVPEAVVYNAGNNQRMPFLDIEPDQFEAFWRVCCYGGFLVGQHAARRMLPRGSGTILFTGASASRRGRPDFAPFASGKAGLRAVAESMARRFGPDGIHVAHVVIDGGIDGEVLRTRAPAMAEARGAGGLLAPDGIAETYWQLHRQEQTTWTFETELRPYKEPF